MEFKISHRQVWNNIDKEKVTIYYIMHCEFPRFDGIIYYKDKLTFWINNIDQSTDEERDYVIKKAHEFLQLSDEAKNLSINYYIENGEIVF